MIYRAWLLAFCFSVISTIFIGRLFYLQIIRGQELATEITQDRHLNELVPARRGRIVDRQGEVIVDNRNVYNLSLVLNDLCLSWRNTRNGGCSNLRSWSSACWQMNQVRQGKFIQFSGTRSRSTVATLHFRCLLPS